MLQSEDQIELEIREEVGLEISDFVIIKLEMAAVSYVQQLKPNLHITYIADKAEVFKIERSKQREFLIKLQTLPQFQSFNLSLEKV